MGKIIDKKNLNNKQQHIVFLTPGFAASEKDTTTIPAMQVYLKSLRKVLPKTKMTLITFQFPFSKEKYDWNDIHVIPLNGKNKKIKKLWTWKKAIQKLKKIHCKHSITTIHSFWIGECSMIGVKFSIKHNIKHITTVMGQDAKLGNNYVEKLRNTNTSFVTLSTNQHLALTKNYNLKSTIIPWDLDVSSFPELKENTIDILGVGSLNKIKNYTEFIAVIFELVKEFPKLKVLIIGEGKERELLEKQIQELKLTTTIKILGEIPRIDVLLKMTQSNILLHTSTYESFGFVFPEALYSGMQIVSFNVGLATSIPTWKVCDTHDEMIKACSSFLNRVKKNKNRVLLNNEDTCASSYIKLYHE